MARRNDVSPIERPIDEAFRLLVESDIVRNHDKLSDDDAWIMARTILEPWTLVDVDGRVLKEIVPPNGDLNYHFTEREPWRAMAKLSRGVGRIRKYLAFTS